MSGDTHYAIRAGIAVCDASTAHKSLSMNFAHVTCPACHDVVARLFSPRERQPDIVYIQRDLEAIKHTLDEIL